MDKCTQIRQFRYLFQFYFLFFIEFMKAKIHIQNIPRYQIAIRLVEFPNSFVIKSSESDGKKSMTPKRQFSCRFSKNNEYDEQS